MKEHLGKIKDDLVSKRDEGPHLNVKLDTQSSRASVSLRELQEENARLKVSRAGLPRHQAPRLCPCHRLPRDRQPRVPDTVGSEGSPLLQGFQEMPAFCS